MMLTPAGSAGRCGRRRGRTESRDRPDHPRRGSSPDEGSGSILAIGVLAAVLVFTGLVLPLSVGFVIHQRVEAAADAAALAAADTALGVLAGSPCAVADQASELNAAALTSCRLDGAVATVTTVGSYLGLAITATARAGPPGSG